MTDELKQWEYDKGYERGKADMLKVIEDIKADVYGIKTQPLYDYVSNDMMIETVIDIINKHIKGVSR